MTKDFKSKRLYRSQSNKMISGVCGGIAEYFEVDYSDEERTLLSVENETDEDLIKAVVDGLYYDIHDKMYN